MAFKKKLYKCRPNQKPETIETFRTKILLCAEPSDPVSIERGVRQLLADKVSGNMVGLWLLVPEHLRLGTWDLLNSWSGQNTERVESRLALQLVHEAALCVTGIRAARCLSQRGFELANGLPFVASDQAIHDLMDAHTVHESEILQLQLGLLRRARGHFCGRLLAIDPHRMRSWSKRQMPRYRSDKKSVPFKTAQTFFCIDTDTQQPVCFTSGTSAMSVTQATPALLRLTSDILNPGQDRPLVVADTEHYTVDLIDNVYQQGIFDLLVPTPQRKYTIEQMKKIPAEFFTPRWAGYATTKRPYQMRAAQTGPHWQFIQRSGEQPDDYQLRSFLATRDRDEVEALTVEFPKRWHAEEFFNANQALGWKRGGTLNLHIRYAQMSMALIAQATLHEFRKRLEVPYDTWDAKHVADAILNGIDGDIRVWDCRR